MNLIHLKIDNQKISIPPDTTILDAAKENNFVIPTLCHLNGSHRFTSCMICVVYEKKSDRLLPSCSMTVANGMEIETNNNQVQGARKDALDLLLSEHVGDCEAPCQRTCPANMNIPLMIRQIRDKKYHDAIITVKRDIALPAVLGRICPAPCEKGCNRKYYDNPLSICYLKRYVADIDLAADSPYCPDISEKSGNKVAIVGAGPAGLSAAYYLRQKGHDCDVFDSNPQLGGMLRYGVGEKNLSLQVLDAEIQQIKRLGIVYHLEHTLGKDMTLSELQQEYQAVILTVGTFDPELHKKSGLELTTRGIAVKGRTFETNIPGIFAGGSTVAPSKMAIRAAAHGKSLSVSVHQFLNRFTVTGPGRRFNSKMGRLLDKDIPEFIKGAEKSPRRDPSGGFSKGYSESEAMEESRRCFFCDCRKLTSCKLRHYAEEYAAEQNRFRLGKRREFKRIIQHKMVIYEPGKCIKCSLCVQITRRGQEKFGFAFANRGFDTEIKVPFDEPVSQGLKKMTKECVESCPTAALSWLDSEEE